MTRETMGHLIGLRYKLMWAKTRSRNGRIALFVVGYLLFVVVAALVGVGGVGAGMMAIKSGKAGLVARVTLSGAYMSALLWTLLLGFGINTVFSDTELRRYPLAPADRRMVKFFVGILDPFWCLILLCDLGILLGIYLFGDASLGLGFLAVLLLLASNYVLATTLGMLIDRLAETRMGSAGLLLFVMTFSTLPGLLAPMLKHNPALIDRILAVLRFTPPFAAADAITASGADAYYGVLLTAIWLAIFIAALIKVENSTFRVRTRKVEAAGWSSRYEQIGALFGAANAGMVGFWLRFYTRNTRVRLFLVAGLPMTAFLTFTMARNGGGSRDWLPSALGAIPVLSYIGTSRIAVNQFGYTAGGFCRFFLLPTNPGAALRAASYASMLLGGCMIPLGLIAWTVLVPGGTDPRKIFMLLCAGITGLLVFNGLGLWSTLFGARKGNYASAVGNDLSAAGNVVLFTCILSGLFLPKALAKIAPAALDPANWAMALIAPVLALAFYTVSLNTAAGMVPGRREKLLKIVEGKL